MFLLTTVVQKAVSRGLHVPGGAVELGGPTTSRAQMSKGLSLFLLVYLSGKARRRLHDTRTALEEFHFKNRPKHNPGKTPAKRC